MTEQKYPDLAPILGSHINHLGYYCHDGTKMLPFILFHGISARAKELFDKYLKAWPFSFDLKMLNQFVDDGELDIVSIPKPLARRIKISLQGHWSFEGKKGNLCRERIIEEINNLGNVYIDEMASDDSAEIHSPPEAQLKMVFAIKDDRISVTRAVDTPTSLMTINVDAVESEFQESIENLHRERLGIVQKKKDELKKRVMDKMMEVQDLKDEQVKLQRQLERILG